jgi:predicted nucleic acid-binding protein
VIVVDSGFLIAFHNERDQQHPKARAAMADFLDGKWGTGLLLEYVFLEVVTVLLVRRDLALAAQVGDALLNAAELEFVPCSEVFVATRRAFAAQRGTRLSFTDTAIATAEARADRRVLTFDEKFRPLAGVDMLPG